jgi:hypothetical protein
MTGKDAKSKFAKTATPAPVQARTEEVVEDSEAASAAVAEVMEADTVEATAVAVEATAVDMAAVAVPMGAGSNLVAAMAAEEDTVVAAVVTGMALRLSKPWLQTRSPTSLPLALSLAQSSMCAT